MECSSIVKKWNGNGVYVRSNAIEYYRQKYMCIKQQHSFCKSL